MVRWAIQLCAGRTTNSIVCERRAEAVPSFITTIIILIPPQRIVSQLYDYLEFYLYATRIASETAEQWMAGSSATLDWKEPTTLAYQLGPFFPAWRRVQSFCFLRRRTLWTTRPQLSANQDRNRLQPGLSPLR
jgi:hypothetical protein